MMQRHVPTTSSGLDEALLANLENIGSGVGEVCKFIVDDNCTNWKGHRMDLASGKSVFRIHYW